MGVPYIAARGALRKTMKPELQLCCVVRHRHDQRYSFVANRRTRMVIVLLHSLNDSGSYNFSTWMKADISDRVAKFGIVALSGAPRQPCGVIYDSYVLTTLYWFELAMLPG